MPETCLECGQEITEKPSKAFGTVWRAKDPGTGAHVLCEPSPRGLHTPNLGPESGHTFRVSVISRGSYSVVGVEGHADSEDFMGEPMTVDVRAWNLPEAVRRASNYPISLWFASLAKEGSS